MSQPTFVTFTALDGTSIRLNVDTVQVVELSAVPTGDLPTGVANGTIIRMDGGYEVKVQGTVAATATSIAAGTPALPAAAITSPTTITKQNGGFASVTHNGVGDYTVTLTGTYPLNSLIALVTPFTDKRIVKASQTGASTVQVKAWDDTGAAADLDFQIAIIYGLT